MEVAVVETSQLWGKMEVVIIGLLAAAIVRTVNIHNETLFVFASLLLLGLFLFIKSAASRLPYPGLAPLIVKISEFAIMVFGFFTATLVGSMTTSFLTTDGSITLRSSNKLFVFFIVAIAGYIIIPKHVVIRDFENRITKLEERVPI
jgi:hypothetical protein